MDKKKQEQDAIESQKRLQQQQEEAKWEGVPAWKKDLMMKKGVK